MLTWIWHTSEADTIRRPMGCTRWLSTSEKRQKKASTGDDFVGIHKDEIQRRVKTLRVINEMSLYLQSSFD